jgi:beta-glucosidase-like glycosyl hydrolase
MQMMPATVDRNERWRVRADARLVPLDELEASDWIPFRKVLAGSNAQLMIVHVTLTSVDPDRAASHSKRVVDGIVRKKWNYQGVVMTNDLVMGAISTQCLYGSGRGAQCRCRSATGRF